MRVHSSSEGQRSKQHVSKDKHCPLPQDTVDELLYVYILACNYSSEQWSSLIAACHLQKPVNRERNWILKLHFMPGVVVHGFKQIVLWIWGQSGLHSQFWASRGHTGKPKQKNKQKKPKTTNNLCFTWRASHLKRWQINIWKSCPLSQPLASDYLGRRRGRTGASRQPLRVQAGPSTQGLSHASGTQDICAPLPPSFFPCPLDVFAQVLETLSHY